MPQLSTSPSEIKSDYNVVVVGSGYGGGVAASRMARAGQSVCILERGREFLSGSFPDTAPDAAQQLQFDLPEKHIGSHTGLFDMHINEDINVLVGCGLGGTSLINANVSLMADSRVFEDKCWPSSIREEAALIPSSYLDSALSGSVAEPSAGTTAGKKNLLEQGYRRAIHMLKPLVYPENGEPLFKMEAHRKSARFMGEKYCRTPINVTFEAGMNHVGIHQAACTLCGDCISGCNVDAKNTTVMNYLPDAHNHGAEIYTEMSVTRIIRTGSRWRVYYRPVSLGREAFDAPEMFVFADKVMLAAGTLGSTEILLRSAKFGLSLSKTLGNGFTGNGDVLAFGYNNDEKINGIGFGDQEVDSIPPVGPCITSVIDARGNDRLEDGMVIEEGSLPGAMASMLPGLFSAAAKTLGQDSDDGLIDTIKEEARILESAVRGAYHGAVNNTQTYLVMAHDNAAGEMELVDDRVRLKWENIGDAPIFKEIEQKLLKSTQALGGTYIPNPMWNELFGNQLVTVHPLGGCTMAENASEGVVNHKCQVFAGVRGADVHEGLYVCDGAIIPRSLGVNPLLTISALAERCCSHISKAEGWDEGYTKSSSPTGQRSLAALGIQFTEKMTGYFSTNELEDYARGAEAGRAEQSSLSVTLTIISNDLTSLLSSQQHAAKMIGTVDAPGISDQPLMVTGGEFNLFVKDPDEVGARQMRYNMILTDETGRNWTLHGFKKVRDDRGFDVWDDTTTLFITLYDGVGRDAVVHGKGILRIQAADFARQMTTMRARNENTVLEGVQAVARFGRFFSGVVYESYSGSFSPFNLYNPDLPARVKRPLSVGAPEIHKVLTEDGVEIQLTRYRGGAKGPVILSHGLGVSSRIFSLDTIDVNLLEYLFAEQYDIWLLDYRVSIELPASDSRSSADEIAKFDYPAAVAKVLQETGQPSVQMVVHCFGATTFFMSMLSGLKGVRSAVVSQIAMHFKAPILSRLKAGLHLPSVLDAMGVDSLTAYVDSHANWMERLYDTALRFYPIEFEERSNSPVDRRITFLYGQLWELDQLNTLTHETLHELFGVANIKCFEHLARMLRKGHVVGFDGSEKYMPNLEKLAIPMTFIHGAENTAFVPESTRLSYDLLKQVNGDIYSRHVIPRYGHIDCIFGKNANVDIYPLILRHLEDTA